MDGDEFHKRITEINSLKIERQKNNPKYFLEMKKLLTNSMIYNNIVFDDAEKRIHVKENELASNGQKTVLNIIDSIGRASTEGKKIVMDDTFESLDNNSFKKVAKHIAIDDKSDGVIDIFTHNLIDIELESKSTKKINYFWINNNGDKTLGGPIRWGTLKKLLDKNLKKDKLWHILSITSRIMGRQISKFSEFYNSNKKYSSKSHPFTLWNVISEITKNNFSSSSYIHKYFAESSEYIKGLIGPKCKDFKEFAMAIKEELSSVKKLKKCDVSIDFLKEFWDAILSRFNSENDISNKYMHLLDFHLDIK